MTVVVTAHFEIESLGRRYRLQCSKNCEPWPGATPLQMAKVLAPVARMLLLYSKSVITSAALNAMGNWEDPAAVSENQIVRGMAGEVSSMLFPSRDSDADGIPLPEKP